MTDKIYSLEEFDDLLQETALTDTDTLVGLKVAYPVGEEEFDILETGRVGESNIGLRVTERCAVCGGQPRDFYLCRGAPGWCYIFSLDGKFLADVRNQEYYCDEHDPRKQGIFTAEVDESGRLLAIVILKNDDEGDSLLHRPPSGRNLEMLN